MELNKVISYINNYYPDVYAEDYQEMHEQLNKAIAESSVAAVTKAIREHTSCPRIIQTVDDGKYTFHSCSLFVTLDFESAYISKGAVYGFGDYKPTSYKKYASSEHPKYPDEYGVQQYLSVWIEFGEICEECGSPFIPDRSKTLCGKCNSLYQVHNYNTQADELLGKEETSETLFGLELEYEKVTARDVAKTLHHHAIAKSDGSIRDGVEIVTRPACVKTHKEKLQNFYTTVKVKAHSNTGMHVHVDKSKLSAYQIGFIMEFLNKETLIPNVEKIARRAYSVNTYCKPAMNRKMTWGNEFNETTYEIIKRPTEKYSPLNTAKDKTIEVRIFSSPESFEEMAAKLDFVAALVKYSSPYAVSVKRLADKFIWENFTGFVASNRKEFPHFYNYFLKEAK